jgi:hypothetical protein
MAQRVILVDDLDGSEGAETITYAVDGVEYEIDLSEDNAKRFRLALDEFVKVSRRVEAPPQAPTSIARTGTRRRSSGGSGRDDIVAVRAWAQNEGIEVAPRGRISKKVLDKYDAAHS